MAAITMNVTPAEFSEIQDAAMRLPEPDFVAFMQSYYGCEIYTSYRVVVRRDVPSIPWFSWDVHRFETEKA